jgi:hypothetical protein
MFVLEKIGIDFHHIFYYQKGKLLFSQGFFSIILMFCRSELKFLQSEFKGQLPKAYSHLTNATRLKENHFNDANKEEMDRYVSILSHL